MSDQGGEGRGADSDTYRRSEAVAAGAKGIDSMMKTIRLLLLLAALMGTVSIVQAQTVHHTAPSAHHAATRHHRTHHATKKVAAKKAAVDKGVKVWVNIPTGVYHYPGSRWYGATRNGTYMTEAAARAEGDRPAANNQ